MDNYTKQPRNGSKLLIVDDHPAMRSTLHNWLAEIFPLKEVLEAGSGEEALSVFKENPPDIVLMDIHMPGINGIDAIKRIKNDHPHTRVIVLTVQEDKRYRQNAEKAGADAYVVKRHMYSNLIPLIKSLNTD